MKKIFYKNSCVSFSRKLTRFTARAESNPDELDVIFKTGEKSTGDVNAFLFLAESSLEISLFINIRPHESFPNQTEWKYVEFMKISSVKDQSVL